MSAHTGGGRRPYRNDRRAEAAAGTRAAILEAALRLFVAHGYAKVTIGDIARKAGTAVPTVYASTGGKSAILTVLINRGWTTRSSNGRWKPSVPRPTPGRRSRPWPTGCAWTTNVTWTSSR